jgi:CDP-diacylglycerol---glycerol-3-phosphate 3-phosphatidyltransferase
LNLPNTITLGRIFLVPLLVVVLLTGFDGRKVLGVSNEMLGAAIFGLASFTDWLDGFLARRRGQVTGMGQWMDPLADKLLVTAALISLVQLGRAPAWMVAVILGRELSVTVLRSMIHARGQCLPASSLGKVKMAAQVTAILLLILAPHMGALFVLGEVALWVATLAALVSAVDYWRRFNAWLPALVPPSAAAASGAPGRDSARDRVSA